jgi:hypothetical protein
LRRRRSAASAAGPALALALAALLPLSALSCRPFSPGLPLLATADFEDGTAAGWAPNDPAHWRVAPDGPSLVYELVAPGAPGPVRAPTSVSLWTGFDVSSFELTGRLRCDTDPATAARDMCVVFHYRDSTHFGYVHFAGSSDAVHNIIGLVDGADRVKINDEPAGASVFRLTDRAWHAFKVAYDARTGEVRAYIDDLVAPILTARVRAGAHGLVGVGSFDDTGAFDDLTLWGGPK